MRELNREKAVFQYLRDVVTLELDVETCVGCGMCEAVCPRRVFSVEEGKARIRDRDDCIECGACALNCPVAAIRVTPGVGCAGGMISRALGSRGDCCCSAERCDDR